MNGGTVRFSGAGAGRVFSSLLHYAIGFSLVYLLWGVLSGSGTHVGVEYGFSLLAAFGAAGCLGHLVAYAYRGPEYLSSVFSLLGGVGSSGCRRSGVVLVESTDWPLLVALLLGPFVLLLAGLGGWV